MGKYKKFLIDAYNGQLGLSMCSNWKEKIEESFPELIENNNNTNGWYGDDNYPNWMLYYKDGIGLYGIDANGDWIENCSATQVKVNRPATFKEIVARLIREAKRRGYKVGTFIDNSNLEEVTWPQNGKSIEYDGFDYKEEEDILILGQKFIYQKGQWAEIIEETLDGKEAEIDGNTYILKLKS